MTRFFRVSSVALAIGIGLVGCVDIQPSPSGDRDWVDFVRMCNDKGYPNVSMDDNAKSCQNDLCILGPACIDFENGNYLLGDGAIMSCTTKLELEFPEGPAKVAGMPPSVCIPK